MKGWGMKRLHWHSQNLNDEYFGAKTPGPKWRHGRGWLDRLAEDPDRDGYRWTLGIEWVFPGKRWGFHFGRDDEDDSLSFSIWPVSLYFNLSWKGRRYRSDDREFSVRWHDQTLWWTFWLSAMEWKRSDPKWRRGHFNPFDFVLGRQKFSSQTLEERTVVIPMPERSYSGTAKLTLDTWKRPRWPFPLRIKRAEIDVPEGLPHPGKGENAWDCGEDVTYSITCPADSVEDGVGKLVKTALESREKYGGRDWQPANIAAD